MGPFLSADDVTGAVFIVRVAGSVFVDDLDATDDLAASTAARDLGDGRPPG